MSENVNAEFDYNDPAVLEMAFGDKDLQKLSLNSEEFKAAVNEKFAKTNENDDVTADDEQEQDEDNEEEDTSDSAPKKKAPRGMLKRIENLVEEKHELKRRLDQLEAQAKARPAPKAEYSGSDKPKFADFDSLEEYTEALTDWKLDNRETAKTQAAQAKEMEKAQEAFISTWEEKEAAVKKDFKDYSKVVNVESLTRVDPSDEVKAFLAESEFGPRVIYALLSDEENLQDFIDASSTKQIRMLTRIEDSFVDESPVKKSTATRAPAPPSRLPKGKATLSATDLLNNSGEMSFAEWDAKINEHLRAKKR